MANLQQTIEIIFRATDETGQAISSLSGNIDNAINGISSVTAPLARVADQAVKTEAALVALGVAFLGVATNQAATFNASIREIGTLVNATPDDVANLKQSLQDFATTSTSNFEQITQATYVAVSNFGSLSTAIDLLKVAESGAVVGATDLDTSMSVLSRTMNAYGLVTDDAKQNTENAERVMAALFATVQNGDTTLNALAGALGTVSSTASAAGVPIETLGAAIAAVTAAGISTESATTLLNALFNELLTPSKELADAMGNLSIKTDGLPAVLDRLEASTGGSADKLFELFTSSEAAKGAIILVNDEAGKFENTLKSMDGAVTAFKTNVETMATGLDRASQSLSNSADVLLQNVGDKLEPGIAEIVSNIADVFQGLTISIDEGAFDPLFNAFDGVQEEISQFLTQLAENLPEALSQVDFTDLINSFGEVGGEFSQLFNQFDVSTPEGLANAIQFIVDSLTSLNNVIAGVIDAWGPLVESFLEGIQAFNDLNPETQKAAGFVGGLAQQFELLKGVFTGAVSGIEAIGNALTILAGIKVAETIASVGAAMTGLGPIISATVAAIAGLTFGITENLKAWDEYKQRQQGIADATEENAERQDKIKEKLDEISERTGVVVKNMDEFNKAVDEGRLVFNEANGEWEAAGESIRDFDAEVEAATDNNLAEFAQKLSDELTGVGDAADSLVGTFSSLADAEAEAAERASENTQLYITYKNGLYELRDAAKDGEQSQKDLAEATDEAAKAAEKGTPEWKRVQDALNDAQKTANDFQVAMAKISAEQYEVTLKANTEIAKAAIQADVDVIGSALDSLSTSAEVVGDVISSAFDALAGADEHWDPEKFKFITEYLKQEQQLQKDIAQFQMDLIDAQVAALNAKTEALLRGDPLIEISAGDLEPELNLVLDKIIKNVQIKATQEGVGMLIGI